MRANEEGDEAVDARTRAPWTSVTLARTGLATASSSRRESGKRGREDEIEMHAGLVKRTNDEEAFMRWTRAMDDAVEALNAKAPDAGTSLPEHLVHASEYERKITLALEEKSALIGTSGGHIRALGGTSATRSAAMETMRLAAKLLKACAKAFDESRLVRKRIWLAMAATPESWRLCWKTREDELIRSWVKLLMTSGVRLSMQKDRDVVSECESYVSAMVKEITKREANGDVPDEFGRRASDFRTIIQIFKTIHASFEYCAEAVCDVVFKPLKAFTTASITNENFDSGVHFLSWAIRAVQIASDLSCLKEAYHHRITHFIGEDFLTWSRTLLEVFYKNLSSMRAGSISETLGAWYGSHQNVHSDEATKRACYEELCKLIESLAAVSFFFPLKGQRYPRGHRTNDERFSDKLQRKLTRYVLAVVSCCVKELYEEIKAIGSDLTRLPKWTNGLMSTIERNKSNSTKEMARDILLKLDIGYVFADHACMSACESDHEAFTADISSLFTLLTVNPSKTRSADIENLVDPVFSIFFCYLRARRGKVGSSSDIHDYEAEWKLLGICACFALSSDEQEDETMDGEILATRCEMMTKVVQAAVLDNFLDVESALLSVLGLASIDGSRTALQSDAKTKDKVIPAALAALAMFVRKSPELRAQFYNSGTIINTLLEIREYKGMNAGRAISACILAFEEHHKLVTNLYKPSVNIDTKGERVMEISNWDTDKLRISLRALAEVVKESPSSAVGFDTAVLEVICVDRRLQIMMSKFTSSLASKIDISDHIDKFHDESYESWVFKMLASSGRVLEEAADEMNERGKPIPSGLTCPLVEHLQKTYGVSGPEYPLFEEEAIRPKTDGVRDGRTFWRSIHEWYEGVITHMRMVKSGLKADDELSDVCCILMDGDTDSACSHVGIIVPILMLLHKCRILQEHNLVEELEVSGVGDVEKEACFVIGLLATKVANQNRIADSFQVNSKNGIEQLIPLLKRYQPCGTGPANVANASITRRAADAITNLAHENNRIKHMVRDAGGIPPLVALLDSQEKKVQRAVASTLRTLAFKNSENKNQIVECGALPKLIFMARLEDVQLHKEAIGVIGNLVHSSPHIKRRALDEGALQPVIELLKSPCSESQREAALLLGQFAARLEPPAQGDPDYRTKIVQRGAVQSLIKMLSRHREPGLREMAAFALGRLAQHGDNQVGICHSDGLQPLLNLLESDVDEISHVLRLNNVTGKSDQELQADAKRFVNNLQHNAAFALYGLSDHYDNVANMLKENAFMRLNFSNLEVEQSKQCLTKTINRLKDRILRKDVFNYLAFLISNGKPFEQQRVTLALSWLLMDKNPDELYTVFITKGGLNVLSDMLLGTPAEMIDFSEARTGLSGGRRIVNVVMEALRQVKNNICPKNATELHTMPPPSTPTAEEHMPANFKDPELSDVTFIGRENGERYEFGAHQIAFTHASDAFLSVLDSGKRLPDGTLLVDLEDVSSSALEAMMDFIYSGTISPMSSVCHPSFLQERCEEILSVATRFDLLGLKHLTEKLFIENVQLSNLSLERTCNLYRSAVKHEAAAIQGYLLNHVLDKYDEPWIEDEGSTLALAEYKVRVKAIVECFGKGFVTHIRRLFKEQHQERQEQHAATRARVEHDAQE